MEKTVQNYFATRAFSYNSASWVNDTRNLQPIVTCINNYSVEGLNILDLGAGTGAVSNYIFSARNGRDSLTALDFSTDMLNTIENPHIKKTVSSVENLPLDDGSIDVVVSRQCLHYVADIRKAIDEVARVLKRNGLFVISQFVPYESGSKSYWIQLMKIRQPLRKVFFSDIEWRSFICSMGFSFLGFYNISYRYSFHKWVELYLTDLSSTQKHLALQQYRSLIENAPDDFIQDYKISVMDGDIIATRQMSILYFTSAAGD